MIPILNVVSNPDEKDKHNSFEKEDDNVKIKYTEQINTDKYCFMIKESHYYEPIVYRVNIVKSRMKLNFIKRNI